MISANVGAIVEATRVVISKGKQDEAAARATWPSTVVNHGDVRKLLGGAVFEMQKADSSGNVFGFVAAGNGEYGVTDAGVIGLYPPSAKAAVAFGGGGKADFDAIVQRWAPAVLTVEASSRRPRVRSYEVRVIPLLSDPASFRIRYLDEGGGVVADDDVVISAAQLDAVGNSLQPWRAVDTPGVAVDGTAAAAFYALVRRSASFDDARSAAAVMGVATPAGTAGVDRDALSSWGSMMAGVGGLAGDAALLTRVVAGAAQAPDGAGFSSFSVETVAAAKGLVVNVLDLLQQALLENVCVTTRTELQAPAGAAALPPRVFASMAGVRLREVCRRVPVPPPGPLPVPPPGLPPPGGLPVPPSGLPLVPPPGHPPPGGGGWG